MHVVVANNIYPPIVAGGAELIVSYLCEGLARRGHRVTVVSTCGPEMEPYPTETRNGVEIIRFFPSNLYWSFDRSREPGFKKLLWHARDAWNRQAGLRLQAIFATARPDLLHTHVIDGMSASIWARAKRAGMRVIHTAHDYHLLCPRAFLLTSEWHVCSRPRLACRIYRNWHVLTTRYVDLFISPSRFLLEMHEKAGLRVAHRGVVHNGIPQPDDVERVRRLRPPDSHLRFLMLSRLTVEKGVRVVLDAVARLPRDLGVEIVIAGGGPLENEVRLAAARDRRISYLGYVDGEAKLQVLSRAGYLLLPSLWYENAPVVIIEAAAYGLGLIGSDIGGIPEFVEPGQTGLLFPPGDAAALTAIMTRLALDPDALPALASRSPALARRFVVDRMVDAYEAHYAASLQSARPMVAMSPQRMESSNQA
jgi:glycosyltransferase involved in cell wall biosynthesis